MFFGGNTAAFFGKNTSARRARRPGAASGPGAGRPQARTVALIAAAAAGAGLVTLSGLAWTTPATVAATHPIQVQQRAGITYDAQAPRSAAYPIGQVHTGDPVFLRLVPTMDVQIAYRAGLSDTPVDGLDPAAATPDGTAPTTGKLNGNGLSGTRRVTAELRSTNGWHRGFELLPRAEFTGGGFEAIAPLDLRHVQALVTGVQQATGIDDGKYTLSIRSEIALNGSIAGRPTTTPVRDSFFPELTFSYDGKQLQLADRVTATAGPITEVVRSRTTAVQVPGTKANHLGILGRKLPIQPARIGGLAAGLALLVAAGFAERARRAARRNPPDRIVRRIVLEEASASAKPSKATKPTTPPSRPRVPGPRTAALAERQRARTHPGTRDRD